MFGNEYLLLGNVGLTLSKLMDPPDSHTVALLKH